MESASAANYPCAATLLASLSLEQIDSSPTQANQPPLFEQDFDLFPPRVNIRQTELSIDPPIKYFDNVLDSVDRAYLMYVSQPFLDRASVIDAHGDKERVNTDGNVSEVRTNQSTYIAIEQVDVISRFIELKIVGAAGEELSHSEPMSILRYGQGEFYRPHFDFFSPNLAVSKQLLEDGGQRTASAITYLSAPESGGGTSFPDLDITVPAQAGATLWFRNCSAEGQIDKRSLHAGDPVESGEKWVVTKWFRERETSYSLF